MRLHRFYIGVFIGSKKQIEIESAEFLHQLLKVFRLRIGDTVVMFDGSGSDYECEIVLVNKNTVTLHVGSVTHSRYMPPKKIYLVVAIVKKDNFEFIVEKATELGVTDIIPVLAERSEKKSLNMERLTKIAIEASEQSGRGDAPVIHPVMTLLKAIDYIKNKQGNVHCLNKEDGNSSGVSLTEVRYEDINLERIHILALHTEEDTFSSKEFIDKSPVAVFVGPEGGWSPAEIDMFHKNKIPVRCLGKQILRSETAVIAVLSELVFGF